ncbi:amidase domain-containing protein [Trichoderma breve]|uniref:Amidase domain-containing protein n=1 Tax=Trichoderma breve TaxID=2034170 RepID=A0A9W9EA92_9HYPO|nr:amidase domain-containing protein [Trichoderma breve]KAJ4862356.1 amidase domain-containing protein [Trichoderma breve]
MRTRLDLSKFVGEHVGDVKTTKLLKDTGAVPCVKANISTPLLSFESSNDVWGRPANIYNNKYAPGGSTGGDGALLALGERIGIRSNPLPWKSEAEQEILQKGRLRVGFFRTDGVVNLSPACKRALEKAEYEMVKINPLSPYEALQLAYQLLYNDGLKTVYPFSRRG